MVMKHATENLSNQSQEGDISPPCSLLPSRRKNLSNNNDTKQQQQQQQQDTSPPTTTMSSSVSIDDDRPTRKRSRCGNEAAPMPSCNSAFLDGIFADIAKAQKVSNKRSKTSFCRTESISIQLHCVSSSSSSDESPEIGTLAFPRLPATVSRSSCCFNLSSKQDVKSFSKHQEEKESEDDPRESYGWFVSMEDDDDDGKCVVPVLDMTKRPRVSLAFKAATAPKQVDFEEEEQRALAADTIDQVLGDFF